MKNAVILLSFVVLFAGCGKEQHDPKVTVQSQVGGEPLRFITRPIGSFISVVIGEGIVVNNVKEARTPEGFLEVQVSGYNESMYKKRFQYKAEWLDVNGMTIDSIMSKWMTESVPAKSSFSFKVIGPSPKAVDYRINTRVAANMDN
jgi:hypothetical protein